MQTGCSEKLQGTGPSWGQMGQSGRLTFFARVAAQIVRNDSVAWKTLSFSSGFALALKLRASGVPNFNVALAK